MAKLVVLTQSMAGRSCDLATDVTTVGRVEDNAFQIAEPSVSSRHCEILLRGGDVVIKDLNSTNGTFINGEKISEAVLKPGQTLRLGNVELKLDGRWHPKWCIARQKIAIIVPFRDRQSHLSIFLSHIHPCLQRQLIDYTVFVVEQVAYLF